MKLTIMQYSNYTITKPVHRRIVLIAYPYGHYLNPFSYDKDEERSGSVVQCEKKSKDQDSIQSSITHDPRYQSESDKFTIRHHKREPEVRPSPAGDHKAFGIKGSLVRDLP